MREIRLKALEDRVYELSRSRSTNLQSKPESVGSGCVKHPKAAQDEKPVLPGSSDVSIEKARTTVWDTPTNAHHHTDFVLYDCLVSFSDAKDLLKHFATYYQPHCPFLITIDSPQNLENESKLLLWTIIVIAARCHRKHLHRLQELQHAHSLLYGSVCAEAIQSLPELQAMILLCMWPLPVSTQRGDPSSMHLGNVILCARHMDLDKGEDQSIFGSKRSIRQLLQYPPRLRKLTWLKLFELDVQTALWHGDLPILGASRYYRSVADFCRDSTIPREVANTMQVHVQTARHLLLLDETHSAEAAWSLARSLSENLSSAKESSSAAWTVENDLACDVSQMYINATAYVQVTRNEVDGHSLLHKPTVSARELLVDTKDRAVRVINHAGALNRHTLDERSAFETAASPLPGYPKQDSRPVFFASTVLLQYLDTEKGQPKTAQETARNALQEAHAFFANCTLARSHVRAARSLEVAGGLIFESNTPYLESKVTSRMGASIMHNVLWLRGIFRDRENDAEYAADSIATSETLEKQSAITRIDVPNPPELGKGNDLLDVGNREPHLNGDVLPDGLGAPFDPWNITLDGDSLDWMADFDTNYWDQWLL